MTRSTSRLQRSLVNRRDFSRRAAAAGISIPLLAGLGPISVMGQDGSVVQFANNNSDPESRARMEGTIDQYNALGEYQVEMNTTEHEAFKQAIRTYLASDNPPDVLTWMAGNRMRFFAENDLLMNLDDLYAENNWEDVYPQGSLGASKGSDGSYYFVPTSNMFWVVWYNKSVFEELSLEVPETWDDFLATVDALKEGGKVPISIGTLAPWTAAAWFDYLNMRVNGPEFHIELTDGKVEYTSQEVKDVFARWRELLDREAFLPQPEAYSWQDAVTPFINGEAGMYLFQRTMMDQWTEDQLDNLDHFRFPIIDDSIPVVEDAPTDGFFASAAAPNPDGAKALLTYLGGVESQTYMSEQGSSPAVRTDVSLDLYHPLVQKGISMLQESDALAQFYDRDTHPDMAERGLAAFIEFWNNPDDIDGILERLDEERKRVFESAS